ncbi:unnamed protein product [Peniophora sp. CBMAI 1063]|nr:unnamed protein product [Peniophora sp. CBMAI 1063]
MPSDLAVAEEAAARLRLNCVLEHVGPKLFGRESGSIDYGLLSDGLRFEASIHAAISGALAIQGVEPSNVHSVVAAFQDTAWNTSDGAYDLLEGEYRELMGLPGRFDIPTSPSAPSVISDVASFVKSIGAGAVALDQWWERGDADWLDNETTQASRAAHLFLTTARFGMAPPIAGSGRDGEQHRRAPDIVNTLEHMDGQLSQLQESVQAQRDALEGAVYDVEDRLLAAYLQLYEGAQDATDEVAAVRRHLEGKWNMYGGPAHIQAFVTHWLDSLMGGRG